MADPLDPAALRKVAERALDRWADETEAGILARGCIALLDREDAAQKAVEGSKGLTLAAHRECDRLTKERDEAQRQQANILNDWRTVTKERDRARAAVRVAEAGPDDVWYWQGDGQDCPESLSCPVVMSADTLRRIVGERDAARATLAQIAAAQPPDVAVMEQRLTDAEKLADGEALYVHVMQFYALARDLRAELLHNQQQALRLAAAEEQHSTDHARWKATTSGLKAELAATQALLRMRNLLLESAESDLDEAHAAIWGLICCGTRAEDFAKDMRQANTDWLQYDRDRMPQRTHAAEAGYEAALAQTCKDAATIGRMQERIAELEAQIKSAVHASLGARP